MSFFEGLWQALLDALIRFFGWVRDLVWAIIEPLWAGIVDAWDCVAGHAELLYTIIHDVIFPYFGFVNAWVPVDVFFQMLGCYSAFWLALVVYRSIKKWIPAVSG